ncbi:MAG: lysylphosphatidylglycerol synthase transmembrane domain-containing protein [Candidatus Saccharimonadales bacterium]
MDKGIRYSSKFTDYIDIKKLATNLPKAGSQASPIVEGFGLRLHRSQLITVGVMILVLAVLGPQQDVFSKSLIGVQQASPALLLAAVASFGMTFVFGAAVYCWLSDGRLRFGRTLVAQLAANFINRLLPAGVGGIGANYRYLKHEHHSTTQSATIVFVNNTLGFVGNIILVVLLAWLFPGSAVPAQISPKLILWSLVMTIIVAALLIVIPPVRRRLFAAYRRTVIELSRYRRRLPTLGLSLVGQMALTLANVLAFWLCLRAVGIDLSMVAALLIFSFGFGVGAATPTPGGLGGVEAGLVGALVTYSIAAPTALAAVLVYRFISYWLPLAVSSLFFVYATRRHYFG